MKSFIQMAMENTLRKLKEAEVNVTPSELSPSTSIDSSPAKDDVEASIPAPSKPKKAKKAKKAKEPKPPKEPAAKKQLGGMDQGELNKIFRQTDRTQPKVNRGNKFIEKYLAGETFTLTDGSEVTVEIDPSTKDQLEAMYAKAQAATEDGTADKAKPYTGFNSIKFQTSDGRTVTIHDFAKTSEFGGEFGGKETASGKVSAGGTATTKMAESLQCWYTAAAFMLKHFGYADEKSGHEGDAYEQFVANIDKIAPHVHADLSKEEAAQRPGPVSKKGKISNWEWTLINTALAIEESPKFKHEDKTSFHFYRDASTELAGKLKLLFAQANNNEMRQTGSKPFKGSDKWNPADMWIVRASSLSKIEKYFEENQDNDKFTFAEYNNQLQKWFDNNDLVGVSLKAGDRKTGMHASIMNSRHGEDVEDTEKRKTPKATFDTISIPTRFKEGDILTSAKSVNIILNVGRADYMINMRTFGDNVSSWSAEVIGKGARGGKMGLLLVQRELFTTAEEQGIDKSKVDLQVKEVQSYSPERFVEEILIMNKKLSAINGMWAAGVKDLNEDEQNLLTKPDQWLFSKLIGMKIAFLLERYDEMADIFANKMFKYAFSEHEHSAVYMKVSSFSSHEED